MSAPFPPPAPDGASFTLRRRIDLASGLVAATRLRWRAAGEPTGKALAGIVSAARRAEPSGLGAIVLDAPARLLADTERALDAIGQPARATTIEICERDIAGDRAALGGIERLRARGFAVALRAAPDCPLPLGGRIRSLFSEIVIDSAALADGFIGLEGRMDEPPLGRRLLAALEAGLSATADNLASKRQAQAALAAGCAKGEGPFVDARPRAAVRAL
jgi:hypothetical protein